MDSLLTRSFLALSCLLAPALPGQSYSVTDLGTLGGSFSRANAINNAGQVVGVSNNGTADVPFLYSGGVMLQLGTQSGEATAINGSGLVVGYNSLSGTNTPFFANPGGPLTPIATTGTARAVNASGQILIRPEASTAGSIVFSGGTLGPTLPLVGVSLNDAGTVSGWIFSGIRPHAATYTSGGTLTDISAGLFGPSSYAMALNNLGQVAVQEQTTTLVRSHLFNLGTYTRIGDLGNPNLPHTQALAINLQAFVVGASSLDDGGLSTRAFVFDGSSTFDLNNLIAPGSGWVLTSANGINDLGQIVGVGTIGGVTHAFLLTPPGAFDGRCVGRLQPRNARGAPASGEVVS